MLRPRPLGLTARLLLPMLVVGGLTFGARQVGESALLGEQERTLLDRQGEAVLTGVVTRLSDTQRTWASFTEILVSQTGFGEAIEAGNSGRLASLMAPFVDQLQFGGIRLFDGAGREVIGLGFLDQGERTDVLFEAGLHGSARTAVTVSNKGMHISTTSPVRKEQQAVGLAVVTSIIPTADLVDKAGGSQLTVYKNGRLVDTAVRDARVLDVLRGATLADLQTAAGDQALKKNGYRLAVRHLGDADAIAVLLPTDGLLTETQQTAQVRLGITAVASLAVVLVLFALTRKISRSVASVVATTAEVARGNYTQRVTPNDVPELARLGDAVNEMASELQNRLGELEHRAFHDTLTGLPNRGLFVNRIDHAVRRSQRAGGSIAVLFVDLDDFKVVNDTLGHDAGDTLLKNVAIALQSCTRGGDTVARLGGDEFALLLEPVDGEEYVKGVAQRVLQSLADPMRLNGQQVYVRCSIGMALSTGGAVGADKLVQQADMAMYKAKAEGKGRFAVYAPEMSEAAWERLRVEEDLQQALRGSELRLFYQPLVSLQSSQVIGAEVLLRWQHPTRGLLTPKSFIEVGEQTGLIVPIEEWAFAEASHQLRAWQDGMLGARDFSLNLNVSARQFRNADVVDRLLRHTSAAGIEPRRLTLELAEHTAVNLTDTKPHLLHALRESGFNLAIDDFGVAGSSLSYFKEFPINAVKLDLSFISGLGLNLTDTAIVEAVLGFARSLDLTVTAEGIESPQQLVHLRNLGCELGQGYYFGAPMSKDAFEAVVFGGGAATWAPPTPMAPDRARTVAA